MSEFGYRISGSEDIIENIAVFLTAGKTRYKYNQLIWAANCLR